ncbi:MAG: hypothetical protein M3Q23_11430 [Actinomycetota bacterium]|nr:hypothetical protein [Actinomycetota bacterium]
MGLKDKPKAKMLEGLGSIMEPGEQIQAAVMVLRGPSLWLVGGILGALLTKYYWLAVTDRRVVAVRMGKPGDVLFSEPRASVKLAEATPHAVYSKLAIQRADGTVVRFRAHRMWREEYDSVVAALGGAVPAA